MKVDGTPYELVEHAVPTLRGWFVCQGGVPVAGPYRSRGQALSAAIARERQRTVGGYAEAADMGPWELDSLNELTARYFEAVGS